MEQPKKQNFLRKNLLPSLMLIGIFCGIIFGSILKSSRDTLWTPREIMYIYFVGDIFLRMLKGLIIPLLTASVITSVGSLDLSLSKKIGYRAILWFAITTLLASTEGILLATIFQPGKNKSWTKRENPVTRPVLTIDTVLDIVRNMFPDNIIKATMSEEHTYLVRPEDTNITDMALWKTVTETFESSNILGLVTFTIAVGIAISKTGPAGEAILDVFKSLLEVVMLMTTWVISLSPVGIFFLVSSKIVETEGFSSIIGQIGPYFITLLFGVLFHGYILVPLIYFFCTHKSPIAFLKSNFSAIITGFGTSSSNATLPVAMQCIEENCGIDPRISRFFMPMGASISKDATALYGALAAVYVAQTHDISLNFGSILVIGLVSGITSMGAAGIPHQGIVLLVMVLDSVGLPSEDVSFLFIIDWILERFRTAVNVSGDCFGAGVVAHFSVDELKHLDEIPMTLKSCDQKIS